MTTRTSIPILLGTLAAARSEAAHTVTFVIDLRKQIGERRFDPRADEVGVRGGTAPLSWDRTLLAADPDGDGRYDATVTFARTPFGGQAVTYKFKLERKAAPLEGWEEGRNRLVHLREPAQTVAREFDSLPEPIAVSRVGDIRVHAAFPSRWVASRDVQVWLPPGYDRETSRRYPVLYLHDGQNVFDAAEMGMEWQVDEAADSLLRAGAIAPSIVVAVGNTEARRDEYTPTYVERKREDGSIVKGGGKAPLYGRFLVEELKPFIDRTYRTGTDAARTAVGGASHGGLISLWLVLEHPKVFGNALVMSSSAMWDDDFIIRKVAALPRKLPVRIWLDVGTLEGELVPAARRLRDALVSKGWKLGKELRYLEQEDGQHDEISWASRVPDMLKFLWAKTR